MLHHVLSVVIVLHIKRNGANEMLTLKNGQQVRITSESKSVVTVVCVEPCGVSQGGEFIFQTYRLSKKHHKGSLLSDGVAVI